MVSLSTYSCFFCNIIRSSCFLCMGGIEGEQCPVSLPSSEAKRVTKARTPELFLMERKTISTQDDQIKNHSVGSFLHVLYTICTPPSSLCLSLLCLSLSGRREPEQSNTIHHGKTEIVLVWGPMMLMRSNPVLILSALSFLYTFFLGSPICGLVSLYEVA